MTTNVPPGNPFTPRQVRILKITVVILTALLLLGIGALIFGIVRQVSRMKANPAQAHAPYVLPLALGQGDVKSVFADRGLIIIHWKGDNSDIILTFDPQTGREIGRIQLPRK